MAALVKVVWTWFDLDHSMTAARIKFAITAQGVRPGLLDRGVYVVSLKSPFGVAYPKGHSPTLYIGEGKVVSRLCAHRDWVERLQSPGYPFPIEVACAFPHVQKNTAAYKELEAHLLAVFYRRYGTLPLKNSIHETRRPFPTTMKLVPDGNMSSPNSKSIRRRADDCSATKSERRDRRCDGPQPAAELPVPGCRPCPWPKNS